MAWSLSAQGFSGTQYGIASICSRWLRSPIWHSFYLFKVAQDPNMVWSICAQSYTGTQYGTVSTQCCSGTQYGTVSAQRDTQEPNMALYLLKVAQVPNILC